MTRTELLKAVLAVNEAVDRIVGTVDASFGLDDENRKRADRDLAEIRSHLGAMDNEEVLDAVRRVVATRNSVIESLERRIADLLIEDRVPPAPPSSSDIAVAGGFEAFATDIIRDVYKALCRREGETLLQAAERNRDRIIELARQIDVQDAQLCGVLKVGPDKLFAETSRLVAYVKELEREIENLKDAAKEEGE